MARKGLESASSKEVNGSVRRNVRKPGHEAVVTLVYDKGSRRNLRHEDSMPDMTTEKAEIDGETWTILHFDE